jgi:phenylpyruvate tautomerase PptA (4-oxalocrotonate tautomerase family)
MSTLSRVGPRSRSALIKDITDAVVKNFDVTADAVLVEIVESSRDNKAKGWRPVQRTLSRIYRPSSSYVGVANSPGPQIERHHLVRPLT